MRTNERYALASIVSAGLLAACSGGHNGPRYVVTATAGEGGIIVPASRTVDQGQVTTFTVTSEPGYEVASATGCDGTLSGDTYTTGAITGECAVTVTFAIKSYTVTASGGSGGTVEPSTRVVDHGSTTTFTVTPLEGCTIESVSGCGGTLSGETYTTGPITGDCSVEAVTACGGWWAWMGGSTTMGGAAVYGTLGIPDAGNVPGARKDAVTWKDASGDIWLFGGVTGPWTDYQWHADLWRWDAAGHVWTWVGGAQTTNHGGSHGTLGVAAASNQPGARASAVGWTDESGDLWLFGGVGYDDFGLRDHLSDMWRYELATGMWTWMSGSKNTGVAPGVYGNQGVANAANLPGARAGAISWMDASGDLWIYGGYGYDGAGSKGFLGDLWKYEMATRQWTWMSGSDAANPAAVHGTLGVTEAGNGPGARLAGSGWTDAAGNLWLFGGSAASDVSNPWCNDLWRYEVASDVWTWMGGSSGRNAPGVHGTKGLGAAGNVPGARYGAASWRDASGFVWIFGGAGVDGDGGEGSLNDLWKYGGADWTWMGGSRTADAVTASGTLGVATAGAFPGSRVGAAAWTDANGDQWLFGGEWSFGAAAMNDLWVHSPP